MFLVVAAAKSGFDSGVNDPEDGVSAPEDMVDDARLILWWSKLVLALMQLVGGMLLK